jgi:NitT/TauT family transport system substrate-binding protein
VRYGRIWWGSVLMAFMLIVAAGCGGSGTAKSPEPTAADKAAQPKAAAPGTQTQAAAPTQTMDVKLAPGPKGGVLWLSEMVAEGIGSFKDQGINLSVLPTPGGNEAAKALMSGEADFALLAFDHVLKNRAQGADLVVVGFLTKDPGLIMIVQNDLKGKVTSLKDLKGHKIGVSSLGGGTHMTVLSLLKKAGMESTDVEFVAAKDKLAQMWEAKEISAAMHVDPQITELVGAGKAWVLYDYRKPKDTIDLYGTEYPLGALVTRQEVIDKNPELVQRMVNSILAANQFIKSHTPAEVAAKVPDEYKGGSKLYEQMVKENIEGLASTLQVSTDSMNTVLKELRDKKVIPADSTVDIATSINLTFVSKAAK